MANRNTATAEPSLLTTHSADPQSTSIAPAGMAQPPAVPEASGAELFERLARDPNVEVEKLERLMAMWERTQERIAQAAFNAALSAAQEEMEPVRADASNPQTRSKYASYAALDRALRPVYTRHGFGLTFDTGQTEIPDYIRLVCDVAQKGGRTKQYHLDMPADGKGAKGGDVMTKTHAVGSAVSYGMRYLLKMIFNIAVEDDDGNKAGGKQQNKKAEGDKPEGFDAWWIKMQAAVGEGLTPLKKAFNDSPAEYRTYLVRSDADAWESLKFEAGQIDKERASRR